MNPLGHFYARIIQRAKCWRIAVTAFFYFGCTQVLLAADSSVPSVVERKVIPFKVEPTGVGSDEWRVLAVLLLMIVLAMGILFLLRRKFPSVVRLSGAKAIIRVVEVRPISPRLTLYLIDVTGNQVVLALAGDRVTELTIRPNTSPGSSIDHAAK